MNWLALVLLAAGQPAAHKASDFDLLARQAQAARASNHPAEAVTLYRKAVAVRSNWTEGWWYIGSLLYEENNYADASAALAKFLDLEKQSAAGSALLGLCEFQLAKYDSALRHLVAADGWGLPQNDPLSQKARYHRAILYTHFRQYEAALDELKRLTFLKVESPETIQATGLAALHMPLLPQEAVAGNRDLTMKTGRAVFDSWVGDGANAEREFRELVLRFPENPSLRYLYGSFLLKTDPEGGLAQLRKCLDLDSQYVPAMLQLAFESLTRGEIANGLVYAENAAKLEPSSFVAHVAFGKLLLANDDPKRAISELETATKLATDNPECHFALAAAYGKDGQKQAAAKEHAEFLRLKKLRDPAETK